MCGKQLFSLSFMLFTHHKNTEISSAAINCRSLHNNICRVPGNCHRSILIFSQCVGAKTKVRRAISKCVRMDLDKPTNIWVDRLCVRPITFVVIDLFIFNFIPLKFDPYPTIFVQLEFVHDESSFYVEILKNLPPPLDCRIHLIFQISEIEKLFGQI